MQVAQQLREAQSVTGRRQIIRFRASRGRSGCPPADLSTRHLAMAFAKAHLPHHRLTCRKRTIDQEGPGLLRPKLESLSG